jgi:hypothetical protein
VRRILPTLVFVVGLGVLAGCLPPPPPPQNGQLPDSSLTTVTASCRVANDVADPLLQLMYFSLITGTYVQPETQAYVAPLPSPPRIESCYRTYEMQVWWRNLYCFLGNCEFAAVPGTSVHGWGRAVDFEDAGGELTFGSAGYAWLQANAWRFGFAHPAWAEPGGSSPEPWHWEHP